MSEEPKPTYISKSEPYCVYTHSYQGKIFYVGKGMSARPFQKEGRNKKWISFVDKIKEYQVDIVFWSGSDKEAFKKEKELIMEHNPSCNIYIGNGDIRVGNIARRTTKKKKDLIPMCFRFPEELIDRIAGLAEEKGMAMNTVVTQILDKALPHYGAKDNRDTQETV